MECAISLTDMHGDLHYCRIAGYRENLMLRFTKWIRIKTDYGEEGLENLLHMRDRLCARVNYNVVPASYINALLRDSRFSAVIISIRAGEFHKDAIEVLHKPTPYMVRLTFKGFCPENEILLSINHMLLLKIIQNSITVPEDVFLQLVKKHHAELNIEPVKFESEHAILEAVQLCPQFHSLSPESLARGGGMPEEEKKVASAEPLEVTATGQKSKPRDKHDLSEKRDSRKKEKGKKKKGGKESRETTKERLSAEAVLLDPRVRETRLWLVRSCGLEKEREDFDRAFDEETKKQGKARNCKENSSQDINDDDKEEKIKKKKRKKDDDVKEDFHNDRKEQDSPNAKSPEASSAMLEEMDFDLRVMQLTNVKSLTVWQLAFVLLSNFFRLPIFLVITKYYVTYGVSFIGVCGLVMLFVGVPTIFLELSMGQFTSLPPNTFFERITPIAQGVGFSMIIVRMLCLGCIHVDYRYLFLFFQHLSQFSNPTDDRCAKAGMPFCHTHTMCLPDEEPGLYGSCLTPTDRDVAFKDSVLGEVMKLRALQSSPTQLTVDQEMIGHTVYVIYSYIAIVLMASSPLVDGVEMFATIAKFLVFSGFLAPVVIYFNLEMESSFSFWRAGFYGYMGAYTDPHAWIVAFCLMCSMFNVGEGTWMFVGSWLDFRHKKVIRSIIYTVCCQLLLIFLMAFVFTAWAVNVVNYQHNGYLSHKAILEILRDRPLEFWLTLPTKIIPDKHNSRMFLAYLLFTISSLGYVMTTGEYFLVSLQRALPFLVRVNKVQLRGCALLVVAGSSWLISPSFGGTHVFVNAKVHYNFLGMMLIVIIYEMTIFVYIYGIQRVLVNLKVIYRNDRHDSNVQKAHIAFSRLTPYLKICYRFILMWLLMLGFAYVSEHIEVCGQSLLSTTFMNVVALPWIVGLYKIARHAETTHAVVTLFRSDTRFGPSAVLDRKMAATEENKMGAMGLH